MRSNYDTLVHVPRSNHLIFPWWKRKILHPELQDGGPLSFDVSEIEFHQLKEQKRRKFLSGQVIYDYHIRHHMLEADFGLREFRAIEERGLRFFETHFFGKVLVGWKSVIMDPTAAYVPFQCVRKSALILDWCHIENVHFHVKGFAARLPEKYFMA
ncbi:MAG: hypothetical protein V4481_04985 [Patescibacteria group bacterium]